MLVLGTCVIGVMYPDCLCTWPINMMVLATQVWALLGPMCLCVWLIDMECWLCLVHGSLVFFGRMCLCPWPVDATGANVPLHLAC